MPNEKIPKMRTIGEAIAAMRKSDPNTAFTQTALRRLVRSGEIPSVRIGNKYLINLDTLFSCLDIGDNTQTNKPESEPHGKIRRLG